MNRTRPGVGNRRSLYPRRSSDVNINYYRDISCDIYIPIVIPFRLEMNRTLLCIIVLSGPTVTGVTGTRTVAAISGVTTPVLGS